MASTERKRQIYVCYAFRTPKKAAADQFGALLESHPDASLFVHPKTGIILIEGPGKEQFNNILTDNPKIRDIKDLVSFVNDQVSNNPDFTLSLSPEETFLS